MPAYNFQQQWADDVESGKKNCTIRRRRKRPTRAGDTLYLKAGMRTKHCRNLRTTVCKKVTSLEIIAFEVKLKGDYLSQPQITRLALRDGFESVEAFFKFFHRQYGYAVDDLELIEWPSKK